MIGLHKPTIEQLNEAHVDITAPEHVEISIRNDESVIWVNVDGVCVLRICRIPTLEINKS